MKYLFAALNTLAVIIVFDIDRLTKTLEAVLAAKNGSGMRIDLFFGLVDVANVTYSQATEFIFGLKAIILFIIIFNIVFVAWEYKKSRDRLAKKR